MDRFAPSPEQITSLRKKRNQSQIEAAATIGYTPLSWRQWEKGNSAMSSCAWIVYQLGGLEIASLLTSVDKQIVKEAISKSYRIPKLQEPVYEVQIEDYCAEPSTKPQEPTGVWDIQEETLAAYWGLGRTYDERVGQAMNGDPRYELVYDDVQSWIEVGPYRKAFADHFGFDYDEEI